MYKCHFQSLLVRGMTKNVRINKPMLTNGQKVLSAVIRSSGEKHKKYHNSNC